MEKGRGGAITSWSLQSHYSHTRINLSPNTIAPLDPDRYPQPYPISSDSDHLCQGTAGRAWDDWPVIKGGTAADEMGILFRIHRPSCNDFFGDFIIMSRFDESIGVCGLADAKEETARTYWPMQARLI